VESDIPVRKLADDFEIPVLGLGTWELSGGVCEKAVQTALESGYRHFDTAEFYGNEAVVGDVVTGFDRGKLFLTSKVWHSNLAFDKVLKSCRRSIDRLGTDYLDLYLIHWPNQAVDLAETFRAFRELGDEGLVRSFGVSNFNVNHLRKALPICAELGLSLSVNQVEFHPGLYQRDLLGFCGENGIAVTAYSPLGLGRLGDDEVLADVGGHYAKTWAQVSLRWLLDKDLLVIPRSSNPLHIRQNMDVFDFELSEEDTKRIDALGGGWRFLNPDIAEFDK